MEYENLKDELLSTVDSGLKYARTVDGKAEFELYLFYEHTTRVKIAQGVVDATDGNVEGNAVRVAKEKSVSFASSSGISVERIKRSINEAITSLRSVSIKDERFKGFCGAVVGREPDLPPGLPPLGQARKPEEGKERRRRFCQGEPQPPEGAADPVKKRGRQAQQAVSDARHAL